MVWWPGACGEATLASRCGYSERTVRKALGELEVLGVVTRGRRYEGWVLTRGWVQGELAVDETGVDAGERNIVPLPRSSSSSSVEMAIPDQETKTTTTTTTSMGGEVEELLVEMGCSPGAAVAAIRAAVARGDGLEEMLERVGAWGRYCASARGASITAPGFLTAKRVGEGVDPPGMRGRGRDELARSYVEEMYDKIVRH